MPHILKCNGFTSSKIGDHEAFHMKYQRQIFSVHWRDHVSNAEITNKSCSSSMGEILSQHCVSLFGYVVLLVCISHGGWSACECSLTSDD